MHVKSEIAFTYVDIAKSCINECACFAAEIDLDLASGFDMHSIIKMRNNTSLVDLYTIPRYDKMRRILLKAFDVDINLYTDFVPLFTVNAISEKLLSQGNPMPLDLSLWMYAKNNRKKCVGLENFEQHYEVLHTIPYKYQAKQLHGLSKNVSTLKKEISVITQAYKNAEIKKIYSKAKNSLGKMREVMLYERNDIIVNSIVELKDSGRLFCAVGAAHLYGKNGILAQLSRLNYKIKPIYQSSVFLENYS